MSIYNNIAPHELLGAHKDVNGVHFSIYSSSAQEIVLLLFHSPEELYKKIPLSREGDIWKVYVPNLSKNALYAYQIDGQLVLDPYATSLPKYSWKHPRNLTLSTIDDKISFDWEGDQRLEIPMEELIIYEMHVRGFTMSPSSQVKHPGTFLGLIEKIPYLQDLGVNAVELLPIFSFNELEFDRKNPITNEQLVNYWGYSPLNFFSPMGAYAFSDNPKKEFQEMVKSLHRANIEVILDVVYNHVNTQSGLNHVDAKTYFLFNEEGHHINFSGCGNTLNCNHEMTTKLIMDSLRYWVEEMHVDGFRFDLASILTRGTNGMPEQRPLLLRKIEEDPLLSQVKMIAEPWDIGGLYQVGHFPSSIWHEWNGLYRDSTRQFMNRKENKAHVFSDALSGSPSIFSPQKRPYQSINFVTAHDGFCLKDLSLYEQKHNEANGEANRDGSDMNDSYNFGHEGPTDDLMISSLRDQQSKNFLTALFCSVGTPMLVMGDEIGHTHLGNNNPYCQDNQINWIDWQLTEENKDLLDFTKRLISIRKEHPLLRPKEYGSAKDVLWQYQEETPHLISCTIHEKYVLAFNSDHISHEITLPPGLWTLLVDTSSNIDQELSGTISIPRNSSILLKLLSKQ